VVAQDTDDKRIVDFFGEGGPLSRALAGFEHREGQVVVARQVHAALTEKRSLMVEAGTGTGKTLAYLVPALLSGRRVVVSTATINLQQQIVEGDIPLIERAWKRNVNAVVLKGRNNYLCLRRYERFLRQRALFFGEAGDLAAVIESWAKRTKTGERAELVDLPEEFGLWREIASSPETCLGQKCPYFDRCFVTNVRRAAQAADIVVVNHSLFFVDLMVRDRAAQGVIPRYEAVILDEAHNIERVCLSYFSLSVSPHRVNALVRDLAREMALSGIRDRAIDRAALAVSESSADFFAGLGPRVAEGKARIGTDFYRDRDQKRAAILSDRLAILADRIRGGGADQEEILSAGRRAQEIRDDLEFLLTMPDRGYVFWRETRGPDLLLCATPIDIRPDLERTLYQKVDTIVFVSATLSVMGGFDFLRNSIGVAENVRGVVVPSGFDLHEQALLFVPAGLPPPGRADAFGEIVDMIGRLLVLSRGRALVLFTSIRNMETAYRTLCGTIPFKAMIQGSAPKGALLQTFRDDVSSVLFATASFWEGIDVPGESLSMVIIDKLPFDSPADPVVEAKIEFLAGRDQNPFYSYQLPRAVIGLRQGLGRLIRSRSDRGVLAVLDSRLWNKSYGKVFFESLSHYPITGNIDDVAAFFAGGGAGNLLDYGR
jgi:ATP-dependent DNA helicase DinG